MGTESQIKNGNLGLDGLSVTGDLIVTGSTTIGADALPAGNLTLEVRGKVGAIEYCDAAGGNCTAAADLGGEDNPLITCTIGYRYRMRGVITSWHDLPLDGTSATGTWATRYVYNLDTGMTAQLETATHHPMEVVK